MKTKNFQEIQISSNKVHEGKILTFTVDKVQLPSGKETIREVVLHNGGVTIIAQPEPEKVVLLRQFRYSVRKVLWELPAGRINTGEDPLSAAKRELKEETGYISNSWESLGVVYPAPGYSSEVLYFFKATDLTDEDANPDPDENIEVKIMDLKHAWQMIKDGEMRDAKSIAGLSLVMF